MVKSMGTSRETTSGAGQSLTRRGFVLMAGGVCVGLAAAQLTGCGTPKQQSAGSEELEELTADILIIGGGGSGLSAALTAAEQGKSVVVLEQIEFTGGAFSCAQAETVSTSEGSAKGLDADGLYEYWTGLTGHQTNDALIKRVAHQAADTLSWLEDHGLELYDRDPNAYPVYPVYLRVALPDGGFVAGTGKKFTDIMRDAAEKQGARVFTKTEVQQLLIDDDGRVVGAQASKEKKPLTVHAGKTILATGGFGAGAGKEGNEVIKTYAPQLLAPNLISFDFEGSTGTGIMMAVEAGAATKFAGTCARGNLRATATDSFTKADSLLVDADGQRFVNEGALYTEIYYTALERNSSAYYEIMDARTAYEHVKDYVQDQTAFEGNDVRALAQALGVDPDRLEETVARYNEQAKAQRDSDFEKPAEFLSPLESKPFYAATTFIRIGGTVGGVLVDENAHVIRDDGTTVPNLFACGDCANCNFHYTEYLGAGTGTCWALNTGRIAAHSAVLDA